MNWKSRVLPSLAMSIALFGLAASAQAQATVTQFNEQVPISFITVDCNGQTILADGDSHVMQHSVVDEGGGVHFEAHIGFHLKAVTFVAGRPTLHIINETVNASQNFVGATTFTTVDMLHANTNAKTDNLVIRTFIHTTVNANGQVTSMSFDFETDCRG